VDRSPPPHFHPDHVRKGVFPMKKATKKAAPKTKKKK